MAKIVYRYEFEPEVSVEEIEESLFMAILCCEALHGKASTRLDAGHYFDRDKRSCAIDSTTQVGNDFNRLFVGFALKQFGEDSFSVERVDSPPMPPTAPKHRSPASPCS